MKLFRRYLTREAQALLQNGIRVRFIGDRIRLDETLVRMMDDLELLTSDNDAGPPDGRAELRRSRRGGARDEAPGARGRGGPDRPREASMPRRLPRFLDTYVLPDPDLVIRTSGEARISNFLLWQSAYAEYEFIDTLWPDFTRDGIRQGRDRLRAARTTLRCRAGMTAPSGQWDDLVARIGIGRGARRGGRRRDVAGRHLVPRSRRRLPAGSWSGNWAGCSAARQRDQLARGRCQPPRS